MSDFTAITSQEQLDAVIGDRLKRSEEKWKQRYEGYLSPDEFATKTSEMEKQLNEANAGLEEANKKIATHEKELADRDNKIKGFEISALKHKAAADAGLSLDAVDFLKGEDEETIKASADKFKALMGKNHSPLDFKHEPALDDKNASIKKLAQSLVPKTN
mgnify:CR=1 FL=1